MLLGKTYLRLNFPKLIVRTLGQLNLFSDVVIRLFLMVFVSTVRSDTWTTKFPIFSEKGVAGWFMSKIKKLRQNLLSYAEETKLDFFPGHVVNNSVVVA